MWVNGLTEQRPSVSTCKPYKYVFFSTNSISGRAQVRRFKSEPKFEILLML